MTTINANEMENLSHEEMKAMLLALQAENTTLKLKKTKTKRKKVARPDFIPHTKFHTLLDIPTKLTAKEKKEWLEVMSDGNLNKPGTPYFLPVEIGTELLKKGKDKDGNTKIRVLRVDDYNKEGDYYPHFHIIHDLDVEIKMPKENEGSISTFSLMGDADISPLTIYEDYLHAHPFLKIPDEECDENWSVDDSWFLELLLNGDKRHYNVFIPTEELDIINFLKPSKKDLQDIFDSAIMGTNNIHAYTYYKKRLTFKELEPLRRQTYKGKGKYVGTTNSVQYDENGNEVKADLTNLADRKKYIKIKYEGKKRCECLMEKDGKQRCGGEAKWRLPNGKAFCSSHGGNVAQTAFLLKLAGQPTQDYFHGVRAGWCENNCEGHDCLCSKNIAQQKLCKAQYSALNEKQQQDYKNLKNRTLTNYEELFKAYKM